MTKTPKLFLLILIKLLAPSALVFFGLGWFRNAWAALLLFHGFIIVVHALGLFSRSSNTNVFEIKFSKKFIWGVLIAMPIFTYLGIIAAFAVWSFDNLGAEMEAIGLTQTSFLWFAGYLCLFNGMLEESYWRLLGPDTPQFAHLNDLLYSLFHLPVLLLYFPAIAIPIALIALFFAGAIWRIAKVRLNALWPSILSHSACNFAIWLYLY